MSKCQYHCPEKKIKTQTGFDLYANKIQSKTADQEKKFNSNFNGTRDEIKGISGILGYRTIFGSENPAKSINNGRPFKINHGRQMFERQNLNSQLRLLS